MMYVYLYVRIYIYIYICIFHGPLDGWPTPPSLDGSPDPRVLAVQMHDAILGAGANPAEGPKFTVA